MYGMSGFAALIRALGVVDIGPVSTTKQRQRYGSNDSSTNDDGVLVVESEDRTSERSFGDTDSPAQFGDLCDFAVQFLPETELLEPDVTSSKPCFRDETKSKGMAHLSICRTHGKST